MTKKDKNGRKAALQSCREAIETYLFYHPPFQVLLSLLTFIISVKHNLHDRVLPCKAIGHAKLVLLNAFLIISLMRAESIMVPDRTVLEAFSKVIGTFAYRANERRLRGGRENGTPEMAL